ncbi:MAG: glutamate--tRNA ligase [Candidatus Eremiobacteraeota bacterium]|nr:glutamate--tRNA ligase [Candidatus Eremiobacteraeota bacterium]
MSTTDTFDYTQPLRLRYAPSPTGQTHVGGIRTALFNYLLARRTGGTFILRVEDTDEARYTHDSEATMMRDLQWFGLRWDEGPDVGGPFGPYRQSERGATYEEYACKLLDSGAAYPCYCTPEELEADRETQRARGIVATQYSGRCKNLSAAERTEFERQGRQKSLRFGVPPGETTVQDLIKGSVHYENASFGDFVIVKSTGGPTYNFAAAVDDALMNISLVLRGDEHLNNTPVQMMILHALALPVPRYAHVPLILNEDHSKLSKRHNTVGVDEYRKEGVLPEALLNHLVLLGWAPGDEREEFTLDELSKIFSLERIHESGAVYNSPRLRAFNQRALRKLPREELAAMIAQAMRGAGLLENPAPDAALKWIDLFIEAYGEGLHTIADAIPLVRALRAEAVVIPALELERLRSREVLFYLDAVSQYVDSQKELRALPLSKDLPAIAEEFGLKKRDAYHTVRMALTGAEGGAPLTLLFPLLGHDRIMMRVGAVNSHLLHGRGLEPIKYGPDGKPFEPIHGTKPQELP